MKQSRLTTLIGILLTGTSILSGQTSLSIKGVSFEQDGFEAVKSIDKVTSTGWAINPNESSPNHIHYGVSDFSPGVVEIQMQFNFGTYHVMETFTLSWSDDNGSTWHPITEYSSMEASSGASISVDESGQITTGVAVKDTYILRTILGRVTDLRIDVPANASHRGSGAYLNENYVLSEFTLDSTPVLPIHDWNFDEGSGTVAADPAGSADGILAGATWAEDRFGEADKAVQTGHNMWVDPPDTVKTEVGTFTAWIYADAYGGYNQAPGPIFSAERGSGATNFSYRLQLHESGVIAFEAVAPWGTSTGRVAVSESTIPLATWTHVAGSYDGYTSRVFINGQIAGSSPTYDTYAGMNTSSSSRVGIGHLAGWSVQWFQGRIDDARVYDLALPAPAIEHLARIWHGYPVTEDEWAYTANYLGWVNIHYSPWIWVYHLKAYIYFHESRWVFIPMQ